MLITAVDLNRSVHSTATKTSARKTGREVQEEYNILVAMGKPVGEVLDERNEIIGLLRGQKFDLPDLEHLFEGWPVATNVHVDSLRIVVDQKLDKYALSGVGSEKEKPLILVQVVSAWKKT